MNWIKKLKIFFWIAIIVAFLFFALAIITYFYSSKNSSITTDQKKETKTNKQYEVPVGNSYFIGSSNPKITIIEFADFNCSVCKNIHPKLKNIFLKNAKDIKIVHKDFPVINENSITLGLIARCAGEQGLFWETHDYLYKNQGKINIQNPNQLINNIGISKKEFDSCISSEKYLNDIKRDYALAEKLGVKGTPTLFINGYKLTGDMPEEILEKIINNFIN